MRRMKLSLVAVFAMFCLVVFAAFGIRQIGHAQEKQSVFSTEVPLTVIDFVMKVDGEGENVKIPLDKDAFEVKENGVVQNVEFFEGANANLKLLAVVDFSQIAYGLSYYGSGEIWNGLAGVIGELKKDDWVGIMLYDMKPLILLDFTKNKNAAYGVVGNLMRETPAFSESNLSDAVWDILERLEEDRRHKFAVVLISTGFDTLPKKNFYKEVLERVANNRITFYCVSVGGAARTSFDLESRGSYGEGMNFLQADGRLRALAKASGGAAYFPRFEGEFNRISADIANMLRNQYSIGYYPKDKNFSGKKRKIEIKLKHKFDINGDGKIDKKDEIKIIHKEEYYPGKMF